VDARTGRRGSYLWYRSPRGETIVCDADGVIHERVEAEWEEVDTRAPESLLAVSVDADGERAVAVGEDGTVAERW